MREGLVLGLPVASGERDPVEEPEGEELRLGVSEGDGELESVDVPVGEGEEQAVAEALREVLEVAVPEAQEAVAVALTQKVVEDVEEGHGKGEEEALRLPGYPAVGEAVEVRPVVPVLHVVGAPLGEGVDVAEAVAVPQLAELVVEALGVLEAERESLGEAEMQALEVGQGETEMEAEVMERVLLCVVVGVTNRGEGLVEALTLDESVTKADFVSEGKPEGLSDSLWDIFSEGVFEPEALGDQEPLPQALRVGDMEGLVEVEMVREEQALTAPLREAEEEGDKLSKPLPERVPEGLLEGDREAEGDLVSVAL